jgi:hypothetical protein
MTKSNKNNYGRFFSYDDFLEKDNETTINITNN